MRDAGGVIWRRMEWSEDTAADAWLPRPCSSGFDALSAGEIFTVKDHHSVRHSSGM